MGSDVNDKCRRQKQKGRKRRLLQRFADVGEHDLIRLTEAPQLPELRGLLTASGLRREGKKGRLAIIEINNKHFVTRANLKEMIEQCRATSNRPISGFVPPATTNPENLRITKYGSSAREADKCEALAAALRIAKELSGRSKTILRKGEEKK
jgi:hypothetical protein